ncbi:MAG: 3-keto-5-aminohexanoate cleavage protein [Paracoccaceae bacterium]
MTLPSLMVAPNGARRSKADHPALPVTLPEIVETARACHAAGAGGLHLHLRDAEGRHLLDAGLYAEALAELGRAVPEMAVQITTEAVGMYAPEHQRQVALESGAALVSISIREITRDTEPADSARFFSRCAAAGISVQHILYDPGDIDLLCRTLPDDLLHVPDLQVIHVLGRYAADQDSRPDDLAPFLGVMASRGLSTDWAACAFGRGETACLVHAHAMGGKCRVGFENSLWRADGSLARDNAQRVRDIVKVTRAAPG